MEVIAVFFVTCLAVVTLSSVLWTVTSRVVRPIEGLDITFYQPRRSVQPMLPPRIVETVAPPKLTAMSGGVWSGAERRSGRDRRWVRRGRVEIDGDGLVYIAPERRETSAGRRSTDQLRRPGHPAGAARA